MPEHRSRQQRQIPLVVLLAVVVALLLLSSSPVSAKECEATRSLYVWKHGGGMFRRIGGGASKTWVEYDKDLVAQGNFEEIERDTSQVLLRNEERGVQLVLRDDVCGIKSDGDQAYNRLYAGSFARVADCS